MAEELIHYGVKGMKWGQRKAELNKRNRSYTTADRAIDRRNQSGGTGTGGVKRINRRMNKGQDLETARRNELKFRKRRKQITSAVVFSARYRKQIAAGARVVGLLGTMALGAGVQSVAKRAETKRGQAAAANVFGLPRTASSGPSYTKANRKNVYNISTL